MTINKEFHTIMSSNLSVDSKPLPEKRVFSRVECLLDLELGSACARSLEVEELVEVEDIEAINLSLLGLGFCRNQDVNPLAAGQRVSVGLHGFRPVNALVRWNEGDRVGVQFCGQLQEIVDSWVGEVLAAQGVRVQDLFEVTPSLPIPADG